MPWGICIDEARTLQLHACPRIWKLIRNVCVKNMHPQEDEVVHEILVSHPLYSIFWLSLQFSCLSFNLHAFLTSCLVLQIHFLHHHLHIQSLLSSLQTDHYLGKWRGPSNTLSCKVWERRSEPGWMNYPHQKIKLEGRTNRIDSIFSKVFTLSRHKVRWGKSKREEEKKRICHKRTAFCLPLIRRLHCLDHRHMSWKDKLISP